MGVCNGCQLMVKQNIFNNNNNNNNTLRLERNTSNKFESRFVHVKIVDDNSIFFKNMKDTIFGVWIAHGEGKFINTNNLTEQQKPLKHVYNYIPTEKYPFNPNGSENGLAGIVSENGRHMAMMPHPERSFMNWQIPYLDTKYSNMKYTPWLYMFKNIYNWIIEK